MDDIANACKSFKSSFYVVVINSFQELTTIFSNCRPFEEEQKKESRYIKVMRITMIFIFFN